MDPSCPKGKIYVDIRGGLLERASNVSGIVVNGDFRYFRSLYLWNLHIQGHSYYYEGVSNTITQLRFPGFCFSVTLSLGQWGQICFAEYLKISTFFFAETFCDDSTAIALSCELEHIGASRWNLAPFGPPK